MNPPWRIHLVASRKASREEQRAVGLFVFFVSPAMNITLVNSFCGAYLTCMYYVYVLKNQEVSTRSLYIGFTTDLRRRIKEHLEGRGGHTTRRVKGWKLIYYEAYLMKADALGREKFLKGGSGRRYIYKQLAHYLNGS